MARGLHPAHLAHGDVHLVVPQSQGCRDELCKQQGKTLLQNDHKTLSPVLEWAQIIRWMLFLRETQLSCPAHDSGGRKGRIFRWTGSVHSLTCSGSNEQPAVPASACRGKGLRADLLAPTCDPGVGDFYCCRHKFTDSHGTKQGKFIQYGLGGPSSKEVSRAASF